MPYTKEEIHRLVQESKERELTAQPYSQYPSTRPTMGEFFREAIPEVGRGIKEYGIRVTLPMIDPNIAEEDARERELARIEAQSEQFQRRFTSPEAPALARTIAKNIMPSLGYSLGMAAPIMAGAAVGTAFGPAGTVIGGIAGAVSSVPIGLQSMRRQKMDELEQMTRKRIEPIIGREITDPEWKNLIDKHEYANLAKKYADYEIYPEILGDLALGAIFGFGGIVGKKAIGKFAEKMALRGIPAIAVRGAKLMTEAQLTEHLQELYTNYNQARLDWEHGLSNDPNEENPYKTFKSFPTSGTKIIETIKAQAAPVTLTTLTLGGLLGGGVKATSKVIDIHRINKLRREFDFNDVTQRKSVISRIASGLYGRDLYGEESKIKLGIKGAETIRNEYGTEQNPEMYKAIDDLITAYNKMDEVNKTKDISILERYKAWNRFKLLQTDEALGRYGELGEKNKVENDIKIIIDELNNAVEIEGEGTALIYANELLKITDELGLSRTQNAINDFTNGLKKKEEVRIEAQKKIEEEQLEVQRKADIGAKIQAAIEEPYRETPSGAVLTPIQEAVREAQSRLMAGDEVFDIIADINAKKEQEKAQADEVNRARIESERKQIVSAIKDASKRIEEGEIEGEIPITPEPTEPIVPTKPITESTVIPTEVITPTKPITEIIPIEPTTVPIEKYEKGKLYVFKETINGKEQYQVRNIDELKRKPSKKNLIGEFVPDENEYSIESEGGTVQVVGTELQDTMSQYDAYTATLAEPTALTIAPTIETKLEIPSPISELISKPEPPIPEFPTLSPADSNTGDIVIDTSDNIRYEILQPTNAMGMSMLKNVENKTLKVIPSDTKGFIFESVAPREATQSKPTLEQFNTYTDYLRSKSNITVEEAETIAPLFYELQGNVNNEPLLNKERFEAMPDDEKRGLFENPNEWAEKERAKRLGTPFMIRSNNKSADFLVRSGNPHETGIINDNDVMYQRRVNAPLPVSVSGITAIDSVTDEKISVDESMWVFGDGRILSDTNFRFLPNPIKLGTLFDMRAYMHAKAKEIQGTLDKITEQDKSILETAINPNTRSNIFANEKLQALTDEPNQIDFFGRMSDMEDPYTPLDINKIKDIVSKVINVFANKPSIEIINNIYDIDRNTLSELQQDDLLGEPTGTETCALYDNYEKKMYIIQDKVRNEQDIVLAVLHEVVGHYGLKAVIGDKIQPVMKQVYDFYNKNYKDKLDNKAKLYGLSLDNETHRALLAEELLVDAITDPKITPSIRQRILETIRLFINRILKTIGKPIIELKEITINSDKDIEALVHRARDYVFHGSRIFGTHKLVDGSSYLTNETMLENSDLVRESINDIMLMVRDDAKNGGLLDRLNIDEDKIQNQAITEALERMYNREMKKKPENRNQQIIESKKRNDWFKKNYDNDMINGMFEWINAIANRKYGDTRDEDISRLQWLIGSPEFVEIPAFKGVANAIFDYKDNYEEIQSGFVGKKSILGDSIERLEKFANKNKEEYDKLTEFGWDKDNNKIDYAEEENKQYTKLYFDIFEKVHTKGATQDEVNIMSVQLMELKSQIASKYRVEMQKQGFSEQAIDVWLGIRETSNNVLDKLIWDSKVIVKAMEDNDQKIQDIVIPEDEVTGKKYTVNLMDFIKEMGEMRGYYFPRIRPPGKYGLRVIAEGKTKWLRFFGNKVSREKWAEELRGQGYIVASESYIEGPEAPDTFHIYENISGIENTLQEALNRISFPNELYKNLGDIKTIETRTIDYVRKDNTTEKHFIIDTSDERFIEILKNLGGNRYEEQKDSKNRVWHFTDLTNIEQKILDGINYDYDTRIKAKNNLAVAMLTNVANLAKSAGWRASTIRRGPEIGEEVWQGYEKDPVKAMSAYTNRISSGLAKAQMAERALGFIGGYYDANGRPLDKSKFKNNYEFMEEVRKNRLDPIRHRIARKEAIKMLNAHLAPNLFIENALSVAKSMMIIKYLAGALASGFVNITSMGTSVPGCMNEYAGIPWKKIPKQIAIGAKYYIKYRQALFTHSQSMLNEIPEDIRDVLEKIHNENLDKAQFYQDKMAFLRSKVGKWARQSIDILMFPFEQTERFNRGATIIGTYDYLRKKNPGTEMITLLKQAENISNKAHGIYEKASAPFWAQGKTGIAVTGRAMYTFMKFPHTYLQVMDQMRISRNKWGLLYMSLAPVLIGGFGAMPLSGATDDLDKLFGSPLKKLIGKIFNTDDPVGGLYDSVNRTFGDTAERIAMEGLLGAFTPITIRRSLAVEIPSPEETAPWSMVKDIKYGISDLWSGDVKRAMERIAPRVISSPLRARREWQEGATTMHGKPVYYGTEQLRPTAGETIIRVFGFSPSQITRKKEEIYTAQQIVKKYDSKRTEVYDRYRKYLLKPIDKRDSKELAKIIDMRNKYNKEVREKRTKDKRYLGIGLITSRTMRDAIREMKRIPKVEAGRAMETAIRASDIY